MEIERRWLVEGWPALTPSAVLQMDQGYFAVRPAIRIRREAVLGGETRYVLCFKGGGGAGPAGGRDEGKGIAAACVDARAAAVHS